MNRKLVYSLITTIAPLVVCVAIIINAFNLFSVNAGVAPPVVNFDVRPSEVYVLVNNWRSEHGLGKLEWEDRLCLSANDRLGDIQSEFSHRGFNYEYMIGMTNMNSDKFGENLARNMENADVVFLSWINSPKHKELIEYPVYRRTCIVSSHGFVVQHFAD